MQDAFILVDGHHSLRHAAEDRQELPVIGLKRLHASLAAARHPVECSAQFADLVRSRDGQALAVVASGHGLGDASHGNHGLEQASSHQQPQNQGHGRHGYGARQDRLSRTPQSFVNRREGHGDPDVAHVAEVVAYGQGERNPGNATDFAQSGTRIQTVGPGPQNLRPVQLVVHSRRILV
ncbi:MAG: hypothetical protein OXH11_15730 [Candidatus Aminicenantes bacterium]|nr:hypothetical protein [Candidatus Aminicenantes bacterium]